MTLDEAIAKIEDGMTVHFGNPCAYALGGHGTEYVIVTSSGQIAEDAAFTYYDTKNQAVINWLNAVLEYKGTHRGSLYWRYHDKAELRHRDVASAPRKKFKPEYYVYSRLYVG